MEAKRNSSLDLIRVVAVCSVIGVHFCMNNNYYNMVVTGELMLFLTYLRTALMQCVPLFMILSGYLLQEKKLELSFYKKIFKVLFIYGFAGAFCILFQIVFLNPIYPIKDMIFAFLGFAAAPYGWYIEMYLGLFLLVPFLNMIYHSLKSQKQKQWLLLLLFILTILPTATNIFDFYTPGALKDPLLTKGYQQILPDYWSGLYPFFYYFVGTYLKEYPIVIKKRSSFFLYALFIVVFGTFIYWKNHGRTFEWGLYSEWNSLATSLTTISLFLFLMQIPVTKAPVFIKRMLFRISELSLGMYLTSWIVDQLLYPWLERLIPSLMIRIVLFIPTILFIAAGSFALSAVIEVCYVFVQRIGRSIRQNA